MDFKENCINIIRQKMTRTRRIYKESKFSGERKEEDISERYSDRWFKRTFRSLAGICFGLALPFISAPIIENLPSKVIYPVREREQIVNSLNARKSSASSFNLENLPQGLPEEVRTQLKDYIIQERDDKDSIDKIIKLIEEDSARIRQTPEYVRESGKRDKETMVTLGIGLLSAGVSSIYFILGGLRDYFRKRKEINGLYAQEA